MRLCDELVLHRFQDSASTACLLGTLEGQSDSLTCAVRFVDWDTDVMRTLGEFINDACVAPTWRCLAGALRRVPLASAISRHSAAFDR